MCKALRLVVGVKAKHMPALGLATPHLTIPTEINVHVHEKSCTETFKTAVFIIAQNWIQNPKAHEQNERTDLFTERNTEQETSTN